MVPSALLKVHTKPDYTRGRSLAPTPATGSTGPLACGVRCAAVIEWWSEGAGEGPWDRGEEFFVGSRIV